MPGFNISGSGDGPPNTVETFRQHRWRVTQLGPIFIKPDNSDFIVEGFKLPDVDIDIQEIQGGLLKYKFAKSVNWGDAQITLYDTINLYEQLRSEWQDLVYTDKEGIKSHSGKDGYKKDTVIDLLDGNGRPNVSYTMKNSWPKKISHGPLSYGSSDIKLVTIDLCYDFIEFDWFGIAT